MLKHFSRQDAELVWKYHFGNENWAKDVAGAWIHFQYYGNTDSIYGWEIDHKKPESKGGSDSLHNLRPLQWANNRSKSDNYPTWESVVTSHETSNVNKKQTWTIN